MTRKRIPNADETGSDWTRLARLTAEDIEKMATADAENPPTTAADWADAIIGQPPLKTAVNARFDADLVDWFKSQGRGYQSRMNAVLRQYMDRHRKAG